MSEIVRNYQGAVKENSPVCHVWEFPTSNTVLDYAEAMIVGREPIAGCAENTISTELVMVRSGSGTITIDDNPAKEIYEGDVIIIEPGEKFVWNGDMSLVIVCSPPWRAEQHIIHPDPS